MRFQKQRTEKKKGDSVIKPKYKTNVKKERKKKKKEIKKKNTRKQRRRK